MWEIPSLFMLIFVSLLVILNSTVDFIRNQVRSTVIGYDLMDNEIRMVSISRRRGVPKLIHADCLLTSERKKLRRLIPHQWADRHLNTACCGDVVLLRQIEMPVLPASELSNAVQFELAYQFSWYNDSWVTGWLSAPHRNTDNMQSLTAVFLQREELAEHLKSLRDEGIVPKTVELRSTALYRAVSPLLSGGSCLIVEEIKGNYICSSFREGYLVSQQNFSEADLQREMLSLSPEEDEPQTMLLLITGQENAESLSGIKAYLLAAGIITCDTVQIVAEELLLHYFPQISKEVLQLAPRLSVALGLALREV